MTLGALPSKRDKPRAFGNLKIQHVYEGETFSEGGLKVKTVEMDKANLLSTGIDLLYIFQVTMHISSDYTDTTVLKYNKKDVKGHR